MGKQRYKRVRSYATFARWVFRKTAMSATHRIVECGLWADWLQEIELAVHFARKLSMGIDTAKRYFARQAYRALHNMGFRRPVRGAPWQRRECYSPALCTLFAAC